MINANIKHCLNCGKQVQQTEGRRERKFCSEGCRQKKWQETQRQLRKSIAGGQIKPITAVATKIAHSAPQIPEMPPYDRYKYDIAHANSIEEVKKLVGLAEKDVELAGWQKEQVKKIGIAKSQTLDI